MRRNDTNLIGNMGEAEALRLLAQRGYVVLNLNDRQPNTWTYDLEINTVRGKVKISVKTARAKRDVSLGSPRSLERLANDAFLMILMPPTKNQEIQISPGGYHLLIVPGHVARNEALAMHYEYWGKEFTKAAKNSVRVKDEVNRPGSRSRAGSVFASWNQKYRDAWHLLPEPSPHRQAAEKSSGGKTFSERVVPRTVDGKGLDLSSKARAVGPRQKTGSVAAGGDLTITPRDIVRSLEYLQQAGMSAAQVCKMHHFDKHQSYASLIGYFGQRSRIGSDTNRWFGERLVYVVHQHRQRRRANFAPLISEALLSWPVRR